MNNIIHLVYSVIELSVSGEQGVFTHKRINYSADLAGRRYIYLLASG
jgi:hypothetical protein